MTWAARPGNSGGYRATCCRPCLRIPISTQSHSLCDCFLVRALPRGGQRGHTRGLGSVGACGGAHVWAQKRNGALGRREGGGGRREDARGGRVKARRREAAPGSFRAACGSTQRKPPHPPEAPPTRAHPAPAPRPRRRKAAARPSPLPARGLAAADSSRTTCGNAPGSSDIQRHLFRPQESLLCGHVSWASELGAERASGVLARSATGRHWRAGGAAAHHCNSAGPRVRPPPSDPSPS